MSKQGYRVWNHGVWLDEPGASGQVIENDLVVALSDGSLFLKETWDNNQPVFDGAGRVAVWMQDRLSKNIPGTEIEQVLVEYGKDLAPAWRNLHLLELVQVNPETQTLEVFCA